MDSSLVESGVEPHLSFHGSLLRAGCPFLSTYLQGGRNRSKVDGNRSYLRWGFSSVEELERLRSRNLDVCPNFEDSICTGIKLPGI